MKRSDLAKLDIITSKLSKAKKANCHIFVKLIVVLAIAAAGVAIYLALKKSADEDCYYDDDDFDDDFDDDDFDDDFEDDFEDDEDFDDDDFDSDDFDNAKIRPVE